MAIPFACGMIWLTYKQRIVFIITITLLLGVGSMHATLEKNYVVFPIIKDGEVTFLYDGYIDVYPDKSGSFRKKNESELTCSGCGEIAKTAVFA